MTRVKICGLKSPQDIEIVNEYKPDYIGFVFADFSKRYVTPEKALELKKLLKPEIKSVGVFVNERIDVIMSILESGAIDIVQLHGNEDEEYVAELREQIRCSKVLSPEPEIIQVFNMNKIQNLSDIQKTSADYILLDSGYGTGQTFDWEKLKDIDKPFFLAGGLSLENVEQAVREIAPFAVDVSSGVETQGSKDRSKVERFINLVK